ncbi:type II secretion system protein N [Pseudomonas sp.]|uniref:type II secretion system protein N n=1 Tax=Pseudomonas sp. TaxID=306 RepID=UPI0027362017|nr:type II secretion system protein N [Pseudomonas sp.]MDP2745359.1 type II secretion system protein N [Pseudomonas sp.]
MANTLQMTINLATTRATQHLVLAFVIMAVVAGLCWLEFKFINELQLKAPFRATNVPTTTPERQKLSRALFELFGPEKTDPNPISAPAEQLPESNLNLHVSAIFFMANPGHSSIVLEDGDRTLILKPGDEARPGVSVQHIESNRVTLKRNGKLEQISFRGFGEIASSDLASLPPLAQSSNSEPLTAAASPAPPPQLEQTTPTAYQQFIQRKLAQTK